MDSLQNAWSDTNATIQVGGGKTLSLAGSFAGASINASTSGALFTVKEKASYTVTDSAAASIGGGAKTITQTAGSIAIDPQRGLQIVSEDDNLDIALTTAAGVQTSISV